jgi:protein-S-isoprenylcysteine O-methyltransferase Ste14
MSDQHALQMALIFLVNGVIARKMVDFDWTTFTRARPIFIHYALAILSTVMVGAGLMLLAGLTMGSWGVVLMTIIFVVSMLLEITVDKDDDE